MISWTLKNAIGDWDAEVQTETVRLIEEGTPPYDAADEAMKIVSARRKAKAHQRKRVETPNAD